MANLIVQEVIIRLKQLIVSWLLPAVGLLALILELSVDVGKEAGGC